MAADQGGLPSGEIREGCQVVTDGSDSAEDGETDATSTGRGQSVAGVVVALRDLILARELAPGVQIRQEEMARRIGISRVPLREALRVLATEGLLTHRPHQGYFVAALSPQEVRQIHVLLEFLEAELILSVSWPSDEQLREIREINEAMRCAAERRDHAMVNRYNREFHLAIFRLSPQDVFFAEAERLWAMSDPYRLLHVATTDAGVALVQHDQLLDALAAQDRPLCLRLLTRHREDTSFAALEVLSGARLPAG